MRRLSNGFIAAIMVVVTVFFIIQTGLIHDRALLTIDDLQEQVDQQIILMNALRSNARYVTEVCTLLTDKPVIPEGWYPFAAWYDDWREGT